MTDLTALPDRLAGAAGPADPVPSADGWELVLAENIAYLVDDQRRWQALDELRRRVGLAPEQILAAPELVLADMLPRASQLLRRLSPAGATGYPASSLAECGRSGQ